MGFSQFDQQRFNARFIVYRKHKLTEQKGNWDYCESMGGGERQKKISAQNVQKKKWPSRHSSASGETVGIVTRYMAPFLFGLFVFDLWSIS